ncbi:cytochrome c oxidase subunit 4,13 kD [Monoraphidium neglectum]|uniref:Cytochrome c oxidase subunit 4,13 kD n=1 Tax=Monoraphidium neglectum TaxID=145388 RepID=A0A0D2MVK6_9CHLO|nr:cytochrome c oxidase subunit 4,13 kD [Monoraphidium neglectum]KIZ04532.1 cytochrome c oxidase subunit 4,13 kD [Monoraphidium neglectum]|eukprot:XP_013903551.1 cytochrome c oxidase subunit 4,13 kD [Monoraphidium neglectum]
MSRQLASTLLQAVGRTLANVGTQQQAARQLAPAFASWLRSSAYHTSVSAWAEPPKASPSEVVGPADTKYGYLADKDIWDEAWAYEPRFGTEDNPIVVPSLLAERIIGVTDPQDDTLVIWGIVREGEPPKQLVAGGEFFTLSRVEKIDKVGDKLGIADPNLL